MQKFLAWIFLQSSGERREFQTKNSQDVEKLEVENNMSHMKKGGT